MRFRRWTTVALFAGLASIVACGGGGSTTVPPATTAPAAKPAVQATTAPIAASPAAKSVASPAAAAPTTAASTKAPAPAAKAGPALATNTKVPFTATSTAINYAPFWVALGKDYFKDENLELEIIFGGSGAKQLATIATGSAALGFFDPSDGVKPVQLGQPVTIIGNLYAEPYFLLAVKPEVIERTGVNRNSPLKDRAAALKGLKIGTTTPGSGSDRFARAMLQLAGLNPERDAEIVATGSSANMVAAFARGSLDAVATVSPFIDEAVQRHKGVLLFNQPGGDTPENQKGQPGFLLWGHKPSLQANPAIGVAFLKGVARAIDLIQADPEEAKKGYLAGIQKASDTPPPPKEYVDSGFEVNKNGFPKDVIVSPEAVAKIIKYASDVEGEQFHVTPEQMLDMSYAIEAKKQLGKQ